MHVSIHQAGHHHKIARLVHQRARHNFIEPGDRRNHSPAHVYRRRPLAFRRHHALSAYNQIRRRRRTSRSVRRILHPALSLPELPETPRVNSAPRCGDNAPSNAYRQSARSPRSAFPAQPAAERHPPAVARATILPPAPYATRLARRSPAQSALPRSVPPPSAPLPQNKSSKSPAPAAPQLFENIVSTRRAAAPHESRESVPPRASSSSCTRCETKRKAPTAPRQPKPSQFPRHTQSKRAVNPRPAKHSPYFRPAFRDSASRRSRFPPRPGTAKEIHAPEVHAAALPRTWSKPPASHAPNEPKFLAIPQASRYSEISCAAISPLPAKPSNPSPRRTPATLPARSPCARAPPPDPAAFPFDTQADKPSRRSLPRPHSRHHRFENLHVSRAAAQIPGKPIANLLIVRLRMPRQ